MFHPKSITDLRSGAAERCCGRDVKKIGFAKFSVSSDFRLLQHYLPVPEVLARDGCSPSVTNDIMATCTFWVTRPKIRDMRQKDPYCTGIDYRQVDVP